MLQGDQLLFILRQHAAIPAGMGSLLSLRTDVPRAGGGWATHRPMPGPEGLGSHFTGSWVSSPRTSVPEEREQCPNGPGPAPCLASSTRTPGLLSTRRGQGWTCSLAALEIPPSLSPIVLFLGKHVYLAVPSLSCGTWDPAP